MHSKKLLFAVLFLLAASTFAQHRKAVLPKMNYNAAAMKSPEFQMNCLGAIHPVSADLNWQPVLSNVPFVHEPEVPDHELIERMKESKTQLKRNTPLRSSAEGFSAVVPVLGPNFQGNPNNGMSPLDNSIAISNNGYIVSVANTTIQYLDMNGNVTFVNDIIPFINDNSITNVCDPVVLYDTQADRFIMFVQECSGATANSFIFIFFSQTNNPNDGWWKYKLTGNPLNNSTWFDYPKLALSNNELYISGNLFTNAGVFNQAILYQIDKNNGYAGTNINWQYWYNIAGNPFTLLPLSYGQAGNYGPGCYLVSTASAGGNTFNFFDLTDDMSASNEQLLQYTINTTAFSPAGNASQAGTNCLLDNGDCRALSGFFLNNKVHFVFHSDAGGGWNGINYNRLDLTTGNNVSRIFSAVGQADYCYPSVSSYATNPNDASVMIGFGAASPTIFPEIRVVNCDNAGNWSVSTRVKSSASYVTYSSTTRERWGDYTGTCRKHNSAAPSIWMSGMYGTSNNLWSTWISEIHDNGVGIEDNSLQDFSVYPNPVAEAFALRFDLKESCNLSIQLVDETGKLVKDLYNDRAFAGLNSFTFNKGPLTAGIYHLIIKNNEQIIRKEKIVVAN